MSNPESPLNTATDPATESPVDRPTPGAPSDSATLTEMLNSLADQGFVHQFIPLEGGAIECSECSTTVDAASLDVISKRRLEGASDPDDMMSLVAARCPTCSALGTMLLGYGVNASVNDADVSRALNVPETAPDTGITPPTHD